MAAATMGENLTANLPRAVDHEFVGAELAETHRAAGVEAVGADADLGTVAEFEAVVEAGARVPKDGGAVDVRLETARGGLVARDNGITVGGAVAVDGRDGGVERIDHADGENQVEKLGREIGGHGGGVSEFSLRENGGAGGVAAELDVFRGERGREAGGGVFGDGGV